MAQSCCVDSAIPGYIISLLPDLWMSDVMFSHNGTNGPESKTTLFRWFRQVAVPEAMLLPAIATWFAISRPMKFVLGYHWSAYHRPYEIQTINSNCNRARPCKMIGGRAVCWEDHITCRPSRPYTGVLYFTDVFQIYRFSVLSSFTMLSPMSFVGVFFMVSVTSAQSNINDEFPFLPPDLCCGDIADRLAKLQADVNQLKDAAKRKITSTCYVSSPRSQPLRR